MSDGRRHATGVLAGFEQSDGLRNSSLGKIPSARHAGCAPTDNHNSRPLLHRAEPKADTKTACSPTRVPAAVFFSAPPPGSAPARETRRQGRHDGKGDTTARETRRQGSTAAAGILQARVFDHTHKNATQRESPRGTWNHLLRTSGSVFALKFCMVTRVRVAGSF
jgi:hypothetical protein